MRNFWLLSTAVAATAFAQSAPADRPKFEVASVKECAPADHPPPADPSPGRLSMGCWPLWRLIGDAYEVYSSGKVDPLGPVIPWPIEGGPDWAKSARYSIDAKTEQPESGAMMRGPMMQALLEERFHLRIRREAREVEGYVMTVAKGGLKLRPAAEGGCSPIDPRNFTNPVPPAGLTWCGTPSVSRKDSLMVMDAHGMSLDVFARHLNPDHRPVINRTGLSGIYDIHLEFPVDEPAPPPPDGAASTPTRLSIISAMRDQLGLQLDPGRGPREYLVIDHIEKPSGN